MVRAVEFLVEYNRQTTAQNFGEKLLAVAKKDRSIYDQQDELNKTEIDINWLLGGFEEMDPTPHKEYTQWLCKTYAAQLGVVTKYEDFESRGASALERFHKLKTKQQLQPEHRDINRFRSMQDFEQTVATYPEPQDVVVDKGQVNVVLDDDTLRILHILNVEAAKYYGQGTTWCTAAKNNNMFERYNKEGNLYILLPKAPVSPGEKYQFHFRARQFMDIQDIPIKLDPLLRRFPQVVDLFMNEALANNVVEFVVGAEEFAEDFENLKHSMAETILRSVSNRNLVLKVSDAIYRTLAKQSNGHIPRKLSTLVHNALLLDGQGLTDAIIAGLDSDMFLAGEDLDDTDVQFIIGDWLGSMNMDFEDIAEKDTLYDSMDLRYEVQDRIWNIIAKPAIDKELREYIEEMAGLRY